MEFLKKLILALEEMIEAHRRLLKLSNEKRESLINGDIQGLKSLIQQESKCADVIQNLEDQRKQIVNEYMLSKGIISESFTLERLINSETVPQFKDTLQSIACQLRDLVHEIKNINDSNQQLIQSSLSYIEYSIEMHVRKEPALGYGPHTTKRYLSMLDAKA
jgi:hemerythrin-like domain-containing protein